MSDPFRAIAEFTYDWESWTSPEGKLRWVNGAVERITGYSVDECMTMADYPLALVHASDRPAVAAVLLQARLGQTGNHFEFRVQHKDGGIRWAAISWQPITADGKALGFRSSVRDIDERKRMEQELHAAMHRAEAANHAKTQFLANVTHELRTPLQSIIGYGQLLLGAELKEPLRGFAGTIVQQSEQLEHLVSDLLDYSALQAGMLTIRNEAFMPGEAAARVLESLQPLAAKRGLLLESKGSIRGTMLGDPHRFAQVLTNIVGNAIKYTPAGKVVVTLSSVRASGHIQLRVDDTGPGLPQGAEVFEPFRQGAQPDAHRGGVGLGLALSRQLCTRMGGSLEAQPSKLGGASLVVTLPWTVASTPRRSTHMETPDSVGAVSVAFALRYPLTVMVVDDVDPAREFLVAALEALGYSPLSAACADEAFKIVESQALDVALVDIQMPEIDGWATARGLRARLGDAPYLVALTAQSSADDPSLLRAAGFNGFAGKPIKMALLQSLLSQAYQHKHRPTHEAEVVFDAERWSEMAMITTASGATLLQVMCKRVASALPAVGKRIEAANRAQDRSELARALHEANGLFGLIGATKAQGIASQCELQAEHGAPDAPLLGRLREATKEVLVQLRANAG